MCLFWSEKVFSISLGNKLQQFLFCVLVNRLTYRMCMYLFCIEGDNSLSFEIICIYNMLWNFGMHFGVIKCQHSVLHYLIYANPYGSEVLVDCSFSWRPCCVYLCLVSSIFVELSRWCRTVLDWYKWWDKINGLTLKTRSFHDSNFVVTGDTEGYRYDNLPCQDFFPAIRCYSKTEAFRAWLGQQ